MEIEQLIQEAVKIIGQHLPEAEWQIILFGSQADKTAHPTSDIDIGILGKNQVPLEKMAAIHEGIDHLPSLRSVDVVDLRAVSETFRKKALARSKTLT